MGANIYLKREDTQDVHSFKIRGAYNKMCRMSAKERARGVLAASAGNHAQGVALSAKVLGMSATIVMPETTPQIKIDEVARYGAGIVLHGETYSDAAAEAERLVAEKVFVFIPPYDDPDIIAGQGTVAKEILTQCPEVDSIFVPIGGGGFAAGVAAYVKGVKRGERAVAIVSGANLNFASLCFISLDAAFARIKDEVLADERIDLDEARRLLSILDATFLPPGPCARLIGILRETVGDGEVSAERSQAIAQAIDDSINLRVRTAEDRRLLMGWWA